MAGQLRKLSISIAIFAMSVDSFRRRPPRWRVSIGRRHAVPGALFGLVGRGVLAPGAFADVNVIDLDSLYLNTPEMAADLPLGANRFVQRARGYDYTLVNGRVLVDHDELTDERAGTVVVPA
jgi:N-acyl-D-amino-acid deacylase